MSSSQTPSCRLGCSPPLHGLILAAAESGHCTELTVLLEDNAASCSLGKEAFTVTATQSHVALLSQPSLHWMALVFSPVWLCRFQ